VDWVISFCDVQCFFRFTHFYWHFITHYSIIVTPFTHLTWKDQTFIWGLKVECAFQFLKFYFIIITFLIHANPCRPFILEKNVYNFTLSTILSQLEGNNLFHPIDFDFCNFFSIEINYEIHDKELLTIVDAFEKLCHFYEGVQHESLCILIFKIFNIS
jgi:hypothetical protein